MYITDLFTGSGSGYGLLNCADPQAYVAKIRSRKDPDNPPFHESMHGDHTINYQQAMDLEIIN